jgi:membrane dipeptidase
MPQNSLILTRRATIAAVGGALIAPFINRGHFSLFGQGAPKYSDRSVRLVTESLVIDLLNEFAFREDLAAKHRLWFMKPGAFTPADWQLFKRSGINVLGIGSGGAAFLGGSGSARERLVRFLAFWNGFIAQYPDWFLRVGNAADLPRAKSSGRLGIVLSTQDGRHFQTAEDVELFFGLGQRISQLTYNSRNQLGCGSYEPQDDGLTELGGKVVERMNEVRMAVDCAHAGDRTASDAISVSKRPAIISHGNCRALNPQYKRCIPDNVIKALAEKGGVMGVTVTAPMAQWAATDPPATIEDVINHYDHIARLVGIEHVGLGSDLGIEGHDMGDPEVLKKVLSRASTERKEPHGLREAVPGLEHSRRVYDLTEALIRRKYTNEHIRLILGENWKRCLKEVWGG